MAKKKPELDDMFVPTEEPQAEAPAAMVDPSKSIDEIDIPGEGRTVATGVGLKESELELLDKIADDLNVSRNGLIRFGVRYFLKAYLAGEVQLEFEKQYSKRRSTRQIRMD